VPFSATYGFERGTPIDRYCLHAFLAQQQHLIAGDVLEVQTDAYTQRFGSGVHRADTFDIVPSRTSRMCATSCTVSDPSRIVPTTARCCPTNEPALERSRFVMLAAVSGAELAHRIAYAWVR
jgi:hypothetical protein